MITAGIKDGKQGAGKNKGIRHVLMIEQQRAFLGYVAESSVYNHWLPLFTVLFGTGCRIAEAIELRWEELDYEKRLISINHSVIYKCKDEQVSEYREYSMSDIFCFGYANPTLLGLYLLAGH